MPDTRTDQYQKFVKKAACYSQKNQHSVLSKWLVVMGFIIEMRICSADVCGVISQVVTSPRISEKLAVVESS